MYTREAVIVSLARLARPRIAGLLHAIARTGLEETAVAAAIQALDSVPGPPEQDPLLRTLLDRSEGEIVDPDPEVRARALGRFVFVRPADLADRLLSCLGDPDDEVRSLAAIHLGAVRDPRAVPALFGVVRGDAAEDVRAAGIRALWHHRSPETLELLLEQAARSEVRASPCVLWDLALALGDYDDDRAIDALAAIVLDKAASVVARNTAADRLYEWNRPRLKAVWEAVAHEQNATGSTAREALQDMASSTG